MASNENLRHNSYAGLPASYGALPGAQVVGHKNSMKTKTCPSLSIRTQAMAAGVEDDSPLRVWLLHRLSLKARKKRLFEYFDSTGYSLQLFTVICYLSL